MKDLQYTILISTHQLFQKPKSDLGPKLFNPDARDARASPPCSTLLNEAASEDILVRAERQHRSKRTRQHSEGHIFHPFHNRIIVDGPGESSDAGESKAVKMEAKSWVEIEQTFF